MNSVLPVSIDVATVERFAYQLFRQAAEETVRPARPAASLYAAALNPNRLQRSSPSPDEPRQSRGRFITIPLPYQLWLAHLLWLEDLLHTLECRPAELTAGELAGLQAVARARARFLQTHQVCPHCDAVNPRRTPTRVPEGSILSEPNRTAVEAPRMLRGGDAAPFAGRCHRCHQEL